MGYSIISSDIDQLRNIIMEADCSKEFLPHRHEPDFCLLEFLRGFTGKEGFHIFSLCGEKNEIAGFIAVLPTRNEKVLYIGPMYIRSEYKGTGLGKELVKQLLAWARENSYEKAHSKTWEGNLRSRRIFEGLGFKVFKILENQRVNGDSSIKYELEL